MHSLRAHAQNARHWQTTSARAPVHLGHAMLDRMSSPSSTQPPLASVASQRNQFTADDAPDSSEPPLVHAPAGTFCTGPENQRSSVRRFPLSLAAPCHIGLTPVLSRPSSPYDTSGRRESRNVACEYVTSQMYNECVCMSAIGREFSKAVHQSAWDREVGWIGSRAVESKQAGSTITQQIGHKLEASNFETRTGKDR